MNFANNTFSQFFIDLLFLLYFGFAFFPRYLDFQEKKSKIMFVVFCYSVTNVEVGMGIEIMLT